MSRIQNILNKAERDGTVRRMHSVPEPVAAAGVAPLDGVATIAAPPSFVNRDLGAHAATAVPPATPARVMAAGPIDSRLVIAQPWLRHIFADGGYAGDKLRQALARLGRWTVEIIKRSDAAKGFEVLPRRWVVERTFAWLGRNRRLAKDFEQTIASATVWIFIASVQLLTRRIATHCNQSR